MEKNDKLADLLKEEEELATKPTVPPLESEIKKEILDQEDLDLEEYWKVTYPDEEVLEL